jgi:hypothetical protein
MCYNIDNIKAILNTYMLVIVNYINVYFTQLYVRIKFINKDLIA